MSISSRIQEIETHIGDVYDTINYSYDTTGVNKNIINIPKYLKKGYIDIINNGIDNLYNNFPKVSGIGSNLSLTPTYEAPMKLNEIQGDTQQDGTPTPDSPVEIQSVTGLQNIDIKGKNLFDVSVTPVTTWRVSIISGSNLSLKPTQSDGRGYVTYDIPVSSNTTYTVSVEEIITENYDTFNGQFYLYEYNSSNTQSFIANISKSNLSRTFTTKADTVKLRLQPYAYSGTITDYENITVTYKNIQLEQGSATSYEPYKGNTYEVNLGKNLLDYSTLNYGYVNNTGTVTPLHNQGEMYSEFIKVQPNTTYTFKIIETSSQEANWIGIGEYTANNLSSFIQRITMTTTTQNYYTFTTSATTQYIVASARNLENATKVQLEKGTQATSYTPYFTPIELNKIGDYKDSIKKSTGKNLFDKDNANIINAYFNVNGVISNNDTRSFYIPCKPNTTYTIQKNGSARFRIGTTETIPENGVSVANYIANDNDTPITITTSSTAKYIICYFYATFDTNAKTLEQVLGTIQVEENSQATSYEPYGKVWYVEKQIGKVVLDGSTGSYSNVSTNRFNIDNLITDFKKSEEYNLSLSNYYKSFNQVGSNAEFNTLVSNENYAFDFSSATSYTLRFKDTRYTNVNDFKTWLGTNNVSIIYVLATPTYTEITNTELINQLEELYTAKSQEGTTNISITSEDLEMILNVSALKGEE